MSAKQKDVGSSLAHVQKFFVQVFFGFVRLFFAISLMSPKGPPFNFFFYFAKEWMFKTSRMPPLTFFGTMGVTGDQKFFEKKFKKN